LWGGGGSDGFGQSVTGKRERGGAWGARTGRPSVMLRGRILIHGIWRGGPRHGREGCRPGRPPM